MHGLFSSRIRSGASPIAPTELHLSVAEAIGVSDSGEIAPTELHVSVSETIGIDDSTTILPPYVANSREDLTIAVSEEMTFHVAAAHISGEEDAVAVVEEATILRPALKPSEIEPRIGVEEFSQIHVEGTVYTPIDLNFPLEDIVGLSDSATFYTGTIFRSSSESVAVRETCAIAPTTLHFSNTQGIGIGESFSLVVPKGKGVVIWVEPHNRIVNVKPKHRKHWINTQEREA